MNERKCKKCGIPIIVELSCIPLFDYEKRAKKKELNYVVSGYAGATILEKKRKCVKCGTEFKI
ncbi:MAG TPA: hypothetical protein VI912_03505 [Candidatus Bilamarchaeaceae archaeon]|nr:hypothetical protein [Candidatus Bilamarchaeaceae archaeon]